MFRRYGFAGVQVQIQAVLTLYSQGDVTCLSTPRSACYCACYCRGRGQVLKGCASEFSKAILGTVLPAPYI